MVPILSLRHLGEPLPWGAAAEGSTQASVVEKSST